MRAYERDAALPSPTAMKPGYKTTEFYTALAVVIAAIADQLPTRWGGVAAAAYIVSRGLAKIGSRHGTF